jgi:RNA polymerase sigma-54 factor
MTSSPLLKQNAALHQTQTLTPRLQFAVRLLQMSALDYEQELHELTARNPFLEIDEAGPAPGPSAGPEPGAGPATSSASATEPEPELDGPGDSAGSTWDEPTDTWLPSPGPTRDSAATSQLSATDLMAAHGDLRQHLRGQANLLRLSARDHALACMVIESLDDDGYCRVELDEIGSLTDFEPPVDRCELSMALRLVQSFDPAGVGARTIGECLLLQIELVDPAHRETARAIVTDHLERLAQRDVPGIARQLDRPLPDVDAACAALRRLDPRPGWRFSRPDTRYVVPDVIVKKVRGQWQAQLNGDVVPRLRLNRTYAELFRRHREASHGELGAHLQEARWTLRNVEQRFSTILAVAQAILRRQRLFFEHGPLAMKPLALRDIAAEVGAHESTVCRVTNNKFMATPSGLFELKHFFSRPMPMTSGGACSATAIRSVVKELIDAEDPLAPLSDVEVTQRLARQGLTVARRTVTKYRQALKIAPADRRRRHALPTPIASSGAGGLADPVQPARNG